MAILPTHRDQTAMASSITPQQRWQHQLSLNLKVRSSYGTAFWPAPGSEDTELGVLLELEVGHGEAEVYAGVQA
jgi:hypothetical protein